MAYVRSSLEHRPLSTIQNDMEMGNPSSFEYSALPNDRDRRKSDAHKAQKPLIIFTVNISFLSPFLRYLVLAFGMFFFMCLYGYFQELVVYGWFGRKLSLFCTFLHFLGCSFFAQLQYNYSGRAPIQNDSTSNQANGSSPNAHITAKLNSLSSNLLSNNSGNSKNMKGKIVSFLSCFQAYCHRLQVQNEYLFCSVYISVK
jgi:hypothetical protein